MSPLLVASCYGSAIAVSLLLLWRFGAKRLLLHLAAIGAALAVGLTPLPSPWNTPTGTLVVGWVFLFLLFWGAGGPLRVLCSSPGLHLRHH